MSSLYFSFCGLSGPSPCKRCKYLAAAHARPSRARNKQHAPFRDRLRRHVAAVAVPLLLHQQQRVLLAQRLHALSTACEQ